MGKSWAQALSRAVPLPVYRRLVRRDVISVCYHAVSDLPRPHVRHLIHSKTPEDFERDLLYLKSEFNPVSYQQVAAARAGGPPLPPRAALVTVDDGYAESYSVMRPLLLKHSVPAVFFLITDSIDNRRLAYRNRVSLAVERFEALEPDEAQAVVAALKAELGDGPESPAGFGAWMKPLKLSALPVIERVCELVGVDVEGYLRAERPYLISSEIETMRSEGFEFGGHSRRHPKLADLPEAEVEDEIAGSCQAVAQLLACDQVPFAFPFSAHKVNRELLARIRQRHPEIGLMFDTKGIQKDRPFILSRITADKAGGAVPGQSNLPALLHQAYQYNLGVYLAKLGFSSLTQTQSGL